MRVPISVTRAGKHHGSGSATIALSTTLTVVLLLVVSAQSVLATTWTCPNPPDVYGNANGGVLYLKRSAATMSAVSSLEDFNSLTAGTGNAFIHPMQVLNPTNTDFIGWGTANGVGNNHCATDFTGWNIYMDYIAFGVPDCYSNFGSIALGAQNQAFKLEYTYSPLCGGSNLGWVGYVNGTAKTCLRTSFTSTDFTSVGVEVQGYSVANAPYIDTHFGNLQLYSTNTNSWSDWGSNSTGCAEVDQGHGYYVDKVNDHNTWIRQL